MAKNKYKLLKEELNNFQKDKESITFEKFRKQVNRFEDFDTFKTKVYCFAALLRGRRHLQSVRHVTLLGLKIPVGLATANIIDLQEESGNHLYEVTYQANEKLAQEVAFLFKEDASLLEQ